MSKSNYAEAYNRETERILQEALGESVQVEIDALSEEERAELHDLLQAAQDKLQAAQAVRTERLAAENERLEALRQEELAIQAAAAQVDAARKAEAEALRRAEEARKFDLYRDWELTSGIQDALQNALDSHYALFDLIQRQDFVAQARQEFSQRLGIEAPPADCWTHGASTNHWMVPVFGGALVFNVELVHENLIKDDPMRDLQSIVTLQQGTVLPPGGVIFLPDAAAFGRVLAEYPKFRAEIEEAISHVK